MKIILALALALVISACEPFTPGVATYTSPSWLVASEYASTEQADVSHAGALQ